MRSRNHLHAYQEHAVQFIKNTPKCALWLSMGLGKTVSTLTALADLRADFEAHRTLIIAPLRVALLTWPAEIGRWSHVQHLTAKVLAGRSPKSRGALALHDPSDIHIINRELVPWLVQLFRDAKVPWPYDTVVIDESSSFKSHSTARFKALRKVRGRIARMVQLTGTPTSNGLMDLWAQMFLLDGGERLGRAFTHFRDRFFTSDYMGYKFELRPGAAEKIRDAVSDITLTMSAGDYLDMPPLVVNTVPVDLPAAARKQYAKLEREFLLRVEDETVVAFNAAALTNKLLQCANGAVYVGDDAEQWAGIHDAKLDALDEIVEGTGGAPLLVAYRFRSDVERIKARFPHAEVIGKDTKQIKRWNRGEIAMLLAHPASAGHGLNLQHGGRNAVWFGLNWSLELTQQFDARLYRQGQVGPVVIHRIVARNTADDAVASALAGKGSTQEALLAALRADAVARGHGGSDDDD